MLRDLIQCGYSTFYSKLPNYLSILELNGFNSNEPHDITKLFVNDDNILEIICDPALHALVWRYMRCPVFLSHVKVQYIDGQIQNGNETCFHRDRDDFRQVKLFVYLSDVDINSHPHEFISESHLTQYEFELEGNEKILSKRSILFRQFFKGFRDIIDPHYKHLLVRRYNLLKIHIPCRRNPLQGRILLNLTDLPNTRSAKLQNIIFHR